MSVAFDTLAAARKIEKAGLDRAAAEAIAGAIRSGQGDLATKADLDALALTTKSDLDGLAKMTKADLDALAQSTKADLDALVQATKADLDALALTLRGEMGELRTELRWIKAIGGAIVALLVALLLLAGRIAFAITGT